MHRYLFALLFIIIPSFVFAADEHAASVSGFFWRVFTAAVFFGILYYLLKDIIKNAINNSIEAVKNAIAAAEKANSDAREEFAEYSRKMADMDRELEDMKISARNTAEKEAELMIADAEKNAERLKEMAKSTIKAETEKAKDDLRKETVRLALAEAERILKEDSDVNAKKRYIEDHISKIGA